MNKFFFKNLLLLLISILLEIKTSSVQVVVRKRVPPRGRRVVSIVYPVRVVHSGITLHYSRGVFYRSVAIRGYEVVAPPVGVGVAMLTPRYVCMVV
jgi:hypothetical protein